MKQAHLEMIQGIINRLSNNSFLLKEWSVILISALFALAAKDSNLLFVYLAYFPAISFWGLDAYFLHQEKLFRALYDRVRKMEEEKIDFSMDTSGVQSTVADWMTVLFSKTLLAFHGTILGAIVIVMITIILKTKGG
ncbi:MAG: hypothetical protein A3H42_06500 [Deltaproteobacteria bacterium RIFCSPLOWO2_02_FULL_46_8]|nr:MAG: hypothetical protein A3H42_06500 [Deltaproteobacteria bacterium RIFCSPLOWO2_02_FULL_46_8]